jgi:hypothetical protein
MSTVPPYDHHNGIDWKNGAICKVQKLPIYTPYDIGYSIRMPMATGDENQ